MYRDIAVDNVTWLHSLARRGTRDCVYECRRRGQDARVAGSSHIVEVVTQDTFYKQQRGTSHFISLKNDVKLPKSACRQCPNIIPIHNPISRRPSAIG